MWYFQNNPRRIIVKNLNIIEIRRHSVIGRSLNRRNVFGGHPNSDFFDSSDERDAEVDSGQRVGVHQGPVQEIDPHEALLDDVNGVEQERDQDPNQKNNHSNIKADPLYLTQITFFDLMIKVSIF